MLIFVKSVRDISYNFESTYLKIKFKHKLIRFATVFFLRYDILASELSVSVFTINKKINLALLKLIDQIENN